MKIWPYAFTNPERYPQIWTLKHYAFDDVGSGHVHADCICQRDCAQPGRTHQQTVQAQDPGVAGEVVAGLSIADL